MNTSRPKLRISLALFTGLFVLLGAAWSFSHITDTYITDNTDTTDEIAEPEHLPSIFAAFDETLSENEAGSTTVLLLGISGADYISGELTDTIIFAHLKPAEEKAAMISIPRDFWVSHNGRFLKINELYRIGGGTETPDAGSAHFIRDKVREITGQPVDHVAVVNLDGIADIVDALGGVETEEGHMNGQEALWYIRDRSRPGGDFGRIRRQQKLLLTIAEKLSAEGGLQNRQQLLNLFVAVQKNISTDLPLTKATSLYSTFGVIDPENVQLSAITPQTGLVYSDHTPVNNASIYTLHPTAGKEDYSQIREFVKKALDE